MIERRPTRDHTERMLRAAGAAVRTENAGTPVTIHGELPAQRVTIEPAQRIEPGEIAVPGDFSSAAFFLVAALLVRGSEVRLEGVGINPGRIGLLGILTRMGAAVEVIETRRRRPGAGGDDRRPLGAAAGDPGRRRRGAAGDRRAAAGRARRPASPTGETVVSGAEELRHKESDRIATVVDGLRALGAEIEATDDGFAVTGTGGLRGGALDAAGDHRLAMLGAIAGLASSEGVEVGGFEAAAVSYPGFAADLASALRLRRVAVAGPRREHQQQARVLGRARPRGARWGRRRRAGRRRR